MRRNLKSLYFVGAFLLGSALFAQVRGTVNDGNGFPESDVEVSVKGTDKVVYTDMDGNFDIDAQVGDTLIVNGKEVKVTSSNLGVISSSIDLEEVLVSVAYGKQRKEAIVGSVAVVDEKVLEKQSATNALTALQGSVPGANVIVSGGQPGTKPTIRIRGIGSINASSEPLIVVDGVPFNGDISMISQDMIQSINVLKDAGSTALYGARGANGVILIETKKGKSSGKPQVSFNTQFGLANQAVKMHNTVGAEDFMKYTWEAIKNTSDAASASSSLISRLGYNPYGSVEQPIDQDGNVVPGASLLWDTNWRDFIVNDIATRQEYGINVDGGNENAIYNFGATYLNQEGSIQTSKFERTTVKGNVTSFATDWLELGVSTLVGVSRSNNPTQDANSYQSPIQWIYSVANIYPLYKRNELGELLTDSNGNYIYDYGQDGAYLVNGTRPLLSNESAPGALYQGYVIRNTRTNMNVNGYAKINFTDYLSLKSSLSYQHYMYDLSEWSSNRYGNAAGVGGRIGKQRNTSTTRSMINSLNFDKRFGDHGLRVDGIMETYEYKYEYVNARGTGFLDGIHVLDGTTTPELIGGYISSERNVGYMARVGYDYMRKYYLEASYRKEASSRFHRDVRWGDFFGVGASWVISNENFLKDSDAVNNLKLRASYGEVGNNVTSSYFPYNQSYYAGWSQLDQPGVNIGNLPDVGITWEKTASTNVGLDFGFLKNRISGSVDFFNKESIDLIMGVNVPWSGTGQASILSNIGSVRNYGLEFNLNTINVNTENFEWTTNINLGFVKNEITKLNGVESMINGTKLWEVGNSLYDWYIQEWAGVDPEDGMPMWYKDDANGNKVTTKKYAEAKRYLQDKSSLPDFEGGFSNYFRYRNVDMNILFNFSVGSYIYDSSYAGLMNGGNNAGYQWSTDIKDRWQKPGDVTDVPKLSTVNNNVNSQSTRFLFKNDYLRLKALNVGYNLPASAIDQIGIKGLRVYFQGDNLLTFQSHEGIDPEQSLAGTTNSRSYQQRIFSLGLNVKL
ncbi:SusC/RagA family TonB-linked outer membrane protein [Vaginella massiliensis]|uniref:SusC/RagA family TonB-linked outer membrane protein n=1 Tax=Vaginella massiliensis TaxID=1816680 RepID=UPI00375305A0